MLPITGSSRWKTRPSRASRRQRSEGGDRQDRQSAPRMSPAFTFFIGLLFLILFGWYFVTDYGLRKRLIATLLAVLLVAFSFDSIWQPDKNDELGLDITDGTSF